MEKYNINVSYQNDIRTITINSSTELGEFTRKCLLTYDLDISQIKGIYFAHNNRNIYFSQMDDTKLNITYNQFINKFGNSNRIFVITNESIPQISNKFISDLREYMTENSEVNSQNYYYRPVMHITNYYSNSPPQRQSRPTQPRATQSQPTPPQPTQPQPNNLQFEFNYDYDPTRRQFYINQQQTNSPFAAMMRSLGQNVLDSINSRNTTTNATNNTQFYPFTTGLPSDNVMDQLHRMFMGESQDEEIYVLRETELNNLNQGRYEDLRNNNYILNDCTQCSITLEEFQPDTEVISLPCRHAFKKMAIRHWLLHSSNKCPVCRTVVAEGVPRNDNSSQ